jgi:SSS family solute:Na+ symporter
MPLLTLFSFVAFTALVGGITWWITRRDDHRSSTGYFLGGRSLTFPLIAGSMLLTNLSTEQMVGLNGAAFRDGLSVMVWEVVAVVALVCMALFFLPRFLRGGITTVPQFLEQRFDRGTQVITNLIFLVAYSFLLLPIILYTGATGLRAILDLPALTGIQSQTGILWLTVWLVGILGSIYAIFGGMRTIAVSDTLNGIGLLVGGILITWFGLQAVSGNTGIAAGWSMLKEATPEKFNSIGGPDQSVPFSTIFTGVLLLHLFYWCTNQQIIQRTLAARSLAEGQKGVLLTGALKLLGPLYLVLPGLIAYHLLAGRGVLPDHAYGELVRLVLPPPLAGFFAAVMVGAILSSFNSALNSTTTLFSVGLYKGILNRDATDAQVVKASKVFGWAVALVSMSLAPLFAGQESIFAYLQQMNGMYFIPIFSVVLVGMLFRRVPPVAAKVALIAGFVLIGAGYFVPSVSERIAAIHEYHFLGSVFVLLVAVMLVIGRIRPLPTAWTAADAGAVDLTPWRKARIVGVALIVLVFAFYALFADFSVLGT